MRGAIVQGVDNIGPTADANDHHVGLAQDDVRVVRSSKQRFDVLETSGVDTEAALSSAAYIMPENYLYSVEAYLDYLSVLKDQDILSMAGMDFTHGSRRC